MAMNAMSPSKHPVDLAGSYRELCISAARDFMHTIVVVDDQATYNAREEVSVLVEPESGSMVGEDELDFPATFENRGTALDVSALTDASADLGLTCAVLRPNQNEQDNGTLDKRLLKAASRADVLVLDWQLNDATDGEVALRLLSEVADEDRAGQGRLRLVCFYTSHPRLGEVLSAVRQRLASLIHTSSEPDDPGFWLDCGSMRVIVLAKSGGITLSEFSPRAKVTESDLPQRLVEEFSELTSGLVSNVAVASLAAVRADAHRLLTRFGADLDSPFLSHRFYEGGAESEELVVRLVADEIKSLLDSADVRRWVEPKAIEHWSRVHIEDDVQIKIKDKNFVVSKDDLTAIVTGERHYGVFEMVNQVNTGHKVNVGKEFKDSITEIISGVDSAERLDYEFARLTCLARNDPSPFPGDRSPVLTEGTIVQGRMGKERLYLLCSMPLCDTVRVDGNRSFPFVVLKPTSARGRYDLVAMSPDGERLYLAFATDKHYDTVRHTFVGEGGVVRSKEKSGNSRRFFFKDASGKVWIWVAELRFPHAHRRLHALSSDSSRVGLDEAHILRGASKRSVK